MSDSVIQEIRQIKEANAAKFGHDVHAMLEDLQKRQGAAGRKVVTLAPRRPRVVDPRGRKAVPGP